MSDKERSSRSSASDSDDTLHFTIKRSYFYAITVPLAFILGLALGYLTWGRGAVSAPNPVSDAVSQAAGGIAPTQAPVDIGTQIENTPRVDITIDENDPAHGPEDAPITIVEFADFQCPYCIRHFQETYPQLEANYPDQIRYVFKDFPLTSIHPNAYPAALAARCAFEQDAFWDYHDLLFGGSLGLGSDAYTQYASELGLDMDQFSQCLYEERYADVVQADAQYATQIGVGSTPTFFINGLPLEGAYPFSFFAQIIDYELANPQN